MEVFIYALKEQDEIMDSFPILAESEEEAFTKVKAAYQEKYPHELEMQPQGAEIKVSKITKQIKMMTQDDTKENNNEN